MERGVGSQAVAVRIERLYVLTWIPAWRGVFLRFSAVPLYPTTISSRVTLTKDHVFRLPFATDEIGTTPGQ
jgi:hypothetical protein